MYSLADMARYAVEEFTRGIVTTKYPWFERAGVTPEEGVVRLPKADGSQMNSISWIVAHIASFWLRAASRYGGSEGVAAQALTGLQRFRFTSDDPRPPELEEAMAALDLGRSQLDEWLPLVTEEELAREVVYPPFALANTGGNETVGTVLMRIILHTWFHIGEINAIRQMLGHPEIPFIGRMLDRLEWRPGAPDAGPLGREMYRPVDIANFALSEFERGLENLQPAEATARLEKADGGCMNAISETMGHLAWHWLSLQGMALDKPVIPDVRAYGVGAQRAPAPPSVEEGWRLFNLARESTGWIEAAGEALMAATREQRDGFPPTLVLSESVGTTLMRVALHTWFHTGEVNAIRQLQGYPEIVYIGRMLGKLEWQPAPDRP